MLVVADALGGQRDVGAVCERNDRRLVGERGLRTLPQLARPPGDYLSVFFTSSEASRAAGQAVLSRIFGARTVDRDAATGWQTRLAQYDAVCAWGQPNHSLLERVSAIDKPVFVANGDSDPMILPRYSYLLAGLIPEARLKLYPDAAHGFLFQHHTEFAGDVDAFLASA